MLALGMERDSDSNFKGRTKNKHRGIERGGNNAKVDLVKEKEARCERR